MISESNQFGISKTLVKDWNNAAFLSDLEPEIQDEWVRRISWLRLVDELAENEFLDGQGTEFQNFFQGWKLLLTDNKVLIGCAYEDILTQIKNSWFHSNPSLVDELSIQSWDKHVIALAKYNQPNLCIQTLQQHQTMLEDVGGNFFQVSPFLTAEHWQLAYYLGTADQFYNNLRDLQEDSERKICYFPVDLLNNFGVRREQFFQMDVYQNPGYHKMMQFWLDEYLLKIRVQSDKIMLANDLHPSWNICRQWCLQRYARIERIFRECDFDYTLFSQVY
ncbi:phytoene/squalene synthetase [Cylindrospermum stagnale PCC 7417]|uniref:Phytoene/squalene synthetase n=1 Tax=Cylindrospermum stagnale PCC 7417 TaxID=56107 RepID=K9X217_9NOST|nr:squalene/phytoene synthase family protein [Cylindrospermum stagnale]AFZ26104.1 phytoene/squalene synthetase [Cylindrospermum stagnale PCC 7417]